MKNILTIVLFETKQLVLSKMILSFSIIYLINYVISAVFFKISGSELTTLTAGNAQSFPIQHLQFSFFFTGTFLAIYASKISSQDRSEGLIKMTLTRSVSRLEYFISRVLAILLFCLFITFVMISLSYLVGMIFLGWGNELVFHSIEVSGISGVFITFICGLAFAFSYFGFGLFALIVSLFFNRVAETTVLMAIVLMAGEYLELLPNIQQFVLFHQMVFFHIDIFHKSLLYNLFSVIILLLYCLVFSVVGYLIFRKKDLYV